MRRCLDDGVGSLTVRFAGGLTTTDELSRLGQMAYEVTRRLLDRTKAAGALRADIEVADLSLLFEQLQAVRAGDEQRRPPAPPPLPHAASRRAPRPIGDASPRHPASLGRDHHPV